MAMQFDIALGVFDDGELGRDVVLFVGDAVRVEAFHYMFDAVGNCHRLLFDDFKILDFDDGSGRSHQGDFVDVFEVEVFVGNLYEAFLSAFLAFDVGAEINGVADFLKAQNLNDLEHFVGRYMVDNGAILNG